MTKKLALLSLAAFSFTMVLSQQPNNTIQIDKSVGAIDSIIHSGSNTVVFVQPLFSDDGGEVFLKHLYTVDTIKRILHKAGYAFVNFYNIAFYYSDQRIIKAVFTNTSQVTRPYICEYYFDNDSIFSVMEYGIPNANNSWNKQTISAQAKLYVEQFLMICNMMDKGK